MFAYFLILLYRYGHVNFVVFFCLCQRSICLVGIAVDAYTQRARHRFATPAAISAAAAAAAAAGL